MIVKHTFVLGMEGKQGGSSLDLSHLTEEEQTSILQVVQRDLELRRRDEGRVRSEVTIYSSLTDTMCANLFGCL